MSCSLSPGTLATAGAGVALPIAQAAFKIASRAQRQKANRGATGRGKACPNILGLWQSMRTVLSELTQTGSPGHGIVSIPSARWGVRNGHPAHECAFVHDAIAESFS